MMFLLLGSIFGIFLHVKRYCKVGLLIHRLGTTIIDENVGLRNGARN